jgi:hypothetical protein
MAYPNMGRAIEAAAGMSIHGDSDSLSEMPHAQSPNHRSTSAISYNMGAWPPATLATFDTFSAAGAVKVCMHDSSSVYMGQSCCGLVVSICRVCHDLAAKRP